MHFEVESDREVSVNAIGLLEAGAPVAVSEETLLLFKTIHGVELPKANFPKFVKVTAVLGSEPNNEEGDS